MIKSRTKPIPTRNVPSAPPCSYIIFVFFFTPPGPRGNYCSIIPVAKWPRARASSERVERGGMQKRKRIKLTTNKFCPTPQIPVRVGTGHTGVRWLGLIYVVRHYCEELQGRRAGPRLSGAARGSPRKSRAVPADY